MINFVYIFVKNVVIFDFDIYFVKKTNKASHLDVNMKYFKTNMLPRTSSFLTAVIYNYLLL